MLAFREIVPWCGCKRNELLGIWPTAYRWHLVVPNWFAYSVGDRMLGCLRWGKVFVTFVRVRELGRQMIDEWYGISFSLVAELRRIN
jgi:hypothetical protein